MKSAAGIAAAATAAFLALAAPPAGAIDLQFTQVAGTSQVVDIRHAGDGSGRLFLVTRNTGRVHVLKNGAVLNDPFLDIGARVRSSGGEQGLLSLAFAPDYAASGLFYVWYTDQSGDMTLSRFSVSGNPDLADAGSEEKLLVISQPFVNHNGGRLLFGPDGMLYLSTGDGGNTDGDLRGNGQALDTLLGKIIRIDVNPAFNPYGIPPDNPFVDMAGARPEIWASGLRNPWRFSFDPYGDMLYIGDVGQDRWEEINAVETTEGGHNFGWSTMEGHECWNAGSCSSDGLTFPVAVYGHDEGCSVTGGYVYNGNAIPSLRGRYVYADFCEGWVRSFRLTTLGQATDPVTLGLENPGRITSFGEDAEQELYLATAQGTILRLAPGS